MELFVEAYNRENYLNFLNGRFNFSRSLAPVTIDNNEVESFDQLGFVTTSDDKQLPVFEIHIKPNTRLSRNRVQLRNLVAKQIQTEDGALAVYVDIPNNQWRFSFIAIEWQLTDEGIKEQQTASKRFTYLLGENTQTRTAKDRFGQLNQQSTLENLKQAFAVEPLNKEFYGKLYTWYKKAQEQIIFPNDEQAENHTQTSLIRLLTRLLFIWFIKEKKLINPDLFDKDELQKLIHYDQPSSFYKAILQNLFFATLSTEIKSRDFRKESEFKGKNEDYGNQYRYRYHALVNDEGRWKSLFGKTPFLNGGLFESLDRKLDRDNADDKKLIDEWEANTRQEKTMIRMEGFSERLKNPLAIPNDLFFNSNEQGLGLIDLFNQYQFTVEESTPSDVEVALDPELLGKVFENLLASYNPETEQQARKATGSFYTPREIVSYMVDESLKAYLTQTVPPEDGDNEFYQERIKDLFEASDNTGEFKKQDGTELIYPDEIPRLIKAISQIKILDPAVGSGAYPMGILQRMVALLSVLDPDNEHWKKEQLAIIDGLTDTISHARARKDIEAVFSAENANNNYGRKLYLIEKCIYGVDIQSVAILIAQLRFFISLAIEQTPTADKDKNFGIQPLPNLDYHFEVGNSLIGLPNDYHTDRLEELLRETGELKHQVFSENDHKKKAEIKRQIKEKTEQCYQKIEESIGYRVKFDFRINLSEVFDANDGFDIVIGNPPYAQIKRNTYPRKTFPYSEGRDKGKQNLYKLFVEQSYNLCRDNGISTMIVQSSLMGDLSSSGTRQLLLDKTQLQHIIEFPETAKSKEKQVFDSVTQGTCIYQFIKQSADNFAIDISINNDSESIKKLVFSPIEKQIIQELYPKFLYFPKIATGNTTILQKVVDNTSIKPFLTFIQSMEQGDINLTTHSSQFSNELTPCKLMRGRYVERYKIKYNMADEYIVAGFRLDKIQSNQENCFLISQEVHASTGIRRLHFAVKDNKKEHVLWGHSVNKTLLKNQSENHYFLALLNSKFMDWYFRITSSNNHVQGYEIEQLPIPQIPQPEQQPFIALVDKILTAKQQAQDTTALEAQIDQMVYKLYNLTADEIKIIEAKK